MICILITEVVEIRPVHKFSRKFQIKFWRCSLVKDEILISSNVQTVNEQIPRILAEHRLANYHNFCENNDR